MEVQMVLDELAFIFIIVHRPLGLFKKSSRVQWLTPRLSMWKRAEAEVHAGCPFAMRAETEVHAGCAFAMRAEAEVIVRCAIHGCII
jgi:hypothetical protein